MKQVKKNYTVQAFFTTYGDWRNIVPLQAENDEEAIQVFRGLALDAVNYGYRLLLGKKVLVTREVDM